MPDIEKWELTSWKDFKDEIALLYEERESKQRQQEKSYLQAIASQNATGTFEEQILDEVIRQHPGSQLLFRGQQMASWKLETSLERSFPNQTFSLEEVFHHARFVWNQLRRGERHDFADQEYCTKAILFGSWAGSQWTQPYINALTSLRHMGVPSPMLD